MVFVFVLFVYCHLLLLFLKFILCLLYLLIFLFFYIFVLSLVLVSVYMAFNILILILCSHEISHNDRISPTKELSSSLWRGGSASPARGPHVRSQPLSSITSTLGSAKGQGLKFLQSSRDTLNQPVPTASYRSYRWDVFCDILLYN